MSINSDWLTDIYNSSQHIHTIYVEILTPIIIYQCCDSLILEPRKKKEEIGNVYICSLVQQGWYSDQLRLVSENLTELQQTQALSVRQMLYHHADMRTPQCFTRVQQGESRHWNFHVPSQWSSSISLTRLALDGGSLGKAWMMCWGCFSVAKGKDNFIFKKPPNTQHFKKTYKLVYHESRKVGWLRSFRLSSVSLWLACVHIWFLH